MPHYVMIDDYSGYVWGEATASSPIEAAEIMDKDIGTGPREYDLIVETRALAHHEGAYHVYRAPEGFTLGPIDFQGAEETALIESFEKVAIVRITMLDPDEMNLLVA